MPSAMWSITMPFALVPLDSLVIHSRNVIRSHHQLSLLTLMSATQTLVDSMLCVVTLEELHHVNALPIILEIHMLNANLNVK
jgi:hypothetical protein